MAHTFTTTHASPPEENETTVADILKGPKRITTDEGTVEERSAEDLIKGEQYAEAKKIDKPLFGLGIAKFRTGGAV